MNAGRKPTPVGPDGYTVREREILTLIAKGYHASEVAVMLNRSRHTVADHLRDIFAKMGASTQAEAVYRAVKEGVIQ